MVIFFKVQHNANANVNALGKYRCVDNDKQPTTTFEAVRK